MSTITASLVKELRDKTGAGMMDCKQALTETNGDMEAAIDLLRKKGLSKAAKKSDRVAANGLIGVTASVKSGAVVEVNSETDFVARNPQFQEMVQKITAQALAANGDLNTLLSAKFPGTGNTVDVEVKEAVATIGENMGVRRTAALKVGEGVVADYVHNKAADGLGKIGVLVALESKGDTDALMTLGRQLAMHIAAANPQVVNVEDLSKEAIERERAIYVEQAKAEPKNAGKSDEILAKASEGRLQKEFVSQAVLLKQVFVIDGKATVAEILKSAEKDVGAPVKIAKFVRYQLGEGIEKKQEDFAAEVAKAAGAAAKPAPAAETAKSQAKDEPKTPPVAASAAKASGKKK
jgi:elongation factor Ts